MLADLRDDLPEHLRVQAVAAQHALFSTGDLTEMRCLCERTIELTDGWLRANAWMNLGFAAFNEGHFDQAVEYHLHAYELGEDATDDLF